MGDLTNNFSQWEFACPCCGAANMQESFLHWLQSLRYATNEVINTTATKGGGYRCSTLLENMVKEGKTTQRSMHPTGSAADIYSEVSGCRKLFEMAFSVKGFLNGGIIWYLDRGFVHVDDRGAYGKPPLWMIVTDNKMYRCTTIGDIIANKMLQEVSDANTR